MQRLGKRCFLASVATHGLLFLLMLCGSAFFKPAPKPILTHQLRVVPSRLVDDALAGGGGNPNVKPSNERQKGDTLAVAPRVAPAPAPAPAPKHETPPKPRETSAAAPEPPVAKPEPVKPKAEAEAPKPKAEKAPPKATGLKKPADVGEKPSLLRPLSQKEATAIRSKAAGQVRKQEEARAREEAGKIGQAVRELSVGFSDGTAVEVFGTGGEAYANYGQFVFEVYDRAWVLTGEVDNDRSAVKAQVTIGRNGDVISARVVKPSGNAALNRSVEQALRRVKFVAPFPAGAKDRERTFLLNFNLQDKLGAG